MSVPLKVTADDVQPNRRRGGDIRVLLSPRTVQSTSGFMGRLTLEPGEYVAEHRHPYSEEFLYLVRGSLLLSVEQEPMRLDAGEAVMIPVNARHRVENDGSDQAFVIFHLSPLAPRPELGHVDTEPLPHPQEIQPKVGQA